MLQTLYETEGAFIPSILVFEASNLLVVFAIHCMPPLNILPLDY